MNNTLPRQAGTYILCLHLSRPASLQIGKLGKFDFEKGFYFYIGSAFGPGGLFARCGHHIKLSGKPRWHIDYLRKLCTPGHIIYSTENKHWEHQWAEDLSSIEALTIPVPGFGSSDCQCPGHLFFCANDKIDVVLNTISTQSDTPGIVESN